MLVDGRALPDDAVRYADVCVVGGGPAGITTALRLASRQDRSVIMLESGGLEPDHDSQTLADAESIGTPYFPVRETRIRAIGGGTWSYGGFCMPIEPNMFTSRAWVGDGWPIPAATLDAYLPDALEWCGTSTASRQQAIEDAKLRTDSSGLDVTAFEVLAVTTSAPLRFGRVYRQALVSSSRIDVLIHSTAVGIDIADGQVQAIRVRSGPQRGFKVVARHYVLAAGAIENARLLLLARLGGAAVGRYFMEHPRMTNRYRAMSGETALARLIERRDRDRHTSIRLIMAPERQRAEGLLSYNAYLRFGYLGEYDAAWQAARRILLTRRAPWRDSPYLQDAGGGRMAIHKSDLAAVIRRPDRAAIGALGALSAWPRLRRSLEVVSNLEQPPDPANRIELTDKRDRLGVPMARLRWTVGEDEERTYRRGLAALLVELDRLEPGLSSRVLDAEDPWPGRLLGTWHHMGTARMHHDPAQGVVDEDSRVHGTDTLYVAGSAVFPVSGSTAPTLPIVQLALRLADHLGTRLDAVTPEVASTLGAPSS